MRWRSRRWPEVQPRAGTSCTAASPPKPRNELQNQVSRSSGARRLPRNAAKCGCSGKGVPGAANGFLQLEIQHDRPQAQDRAGKLDKGGTHIGMSLRGSIIAARTAWPDRQSGINQRGTMNEQAGGYAFFRSTPLICRRRRARPTAAPRLRRHQGALSRLTTSISRSRGRKSNSMNKARWRVDGFRAFRRF